ncbi:MAG: hypothetical protein SVV80_09845 [Planctomycetota bacterium]|nr:hypothetical protein [Planctomycetota bacterium]
MKKDDTAIPARWDKQVNWWLLLIAPVVLAGATVAANLLEFDSSASSASADWLEIFAPYLAAAGLAIYAVRAIVTRKPLFLMLTFLAAAMFLREIDWKNWTVIVWTHLGIYAAFVIVAACMVIWRKKIAETLRDRWFISLVAASVWAFILSQLVARRVFKDKAWRLAIIPKEDEIHLFLEEVVETAGHLLWIAGAVVGSWRRGATRQKETKPK